MLCIGVVSGPSAGKSPSLFDSLSVDAGDGGRYCLASAQADGLGIELLRRVLPFLQQSANPRGHSARLLVLAMDA